MKLKLRGMALLARLLPVERAVAGAVGVLTVALAAIALIGNRAQPQVLTFSWAERRIGRDDGGFTLTFDRPLVWEGVAERLEISPPLPGKLSWAGHTLAYVPHEVPNYGTEYKLSLTGARAQPQRPQASAPLLPPFETTFTTRDRAFAYLGVEGEEAGRLILRNETQDERVELTPPDLVVTNFEPYVGGERILFSAYERRRGQGIADQQLYTVSTGLTAGTERQAGRLELLLPADDYQNLQFDLADSGQLVVVQRVNRQNRADAGLWLLPAEGEPRPLGAQGNRFKIAPDGRAVAIAQERGVALVPLLESADGSWEFFPGYQNLLAFSRRDRQQKLMVRENDNLTQSLYLVDSSGRARELLATRGQFLGCEFEPRREAYLYCLHTEALDADQATTSPFLTLVDVASAEGIPLVALTDDLNVRMSMAPDGSTLLFDQVARPTADEDEAIAGSIWQMVLPDLNASEPYANFDPPQEAMPGLDPRWLP